MNPWITPKTNWRVRIDPWTGNYLGDFFNVADYERIVGNIKYLHDIARRASPDDVTIKPLAPMHWGVPITEKTINAIEQDLYRLGQTCGLQLAITYWHGNDKAPTYQDYNRIEGHCLALYAIYEGALKHEKLWPEMAFELMGGEF